MTEATEQVWPVVGGEYRFRDARGLIVGRVLSFQGDEYLVEYWYGSETEPYYAANLSARAFRTLFLPTDQSALPRLYAVLEKIRSECRDAPAQSLTDSCLEEVDSLLAERKGA